MAPLTLIEKYNDLIRCADQPLSSYDKLTNEDFEDVISKKWPFIIHSITYQPLNQEKDNSIMSSKNSFTTQVRTKLERRLKIHFPLYSQVAQRHQQKFPNRKAILRTHITTNTTPIESLSIQTTSTFSLDDKSKKILPDFYVFTSSKHSRRIFINFDYVRKYLMNATQVPSYKILVFKQAIQECCHYGNYFFLNSLSSTMNIPIENIYFDNHDTILHQCIKLNNKQLTMELIQHRFDININGELGTPLVTAIHYDLLWAVELLLNNGADLTKRHIDWPLLTLYQYCIQFNKIDIKLIIDRYIVLLIRKKNHIVLKKLLNDGWNISLKKRFYYHHPFLHVSSQQKKIVDNWQMSFTS